MSSPARDRRPPPLSQLRPIAQGAKVEGDRRLTYRAFRRLSIYITWALLHTRVTPNQVTISSLVVAGAGLAILAVPGSAFAIAGCAMLLVYHLLDRVDGELARYQERYSLLGVYLDNAGHYLTGGGLLVAASFHLSQEASNPRLVLLIGSLGAIAAIMSRVEKHAPFHLYSQYVVDNPELTESVRSGSGPLTREAAKSARASGDELRSRPLSMIRDTILMLASFPSAVLLLLAGFITEVVGPRGVGVTALYIVAGLQVVSYLGVEYANLSGNLGAESKRLARKTGGPSSG